MSCVWLNGQKLNLLLFIAYEQHFSCGSLWEREKKMCVNAGLWKITNTWEICRKLNLCFFKLQLGRLLNIHFCLEKMLNSHKLGSLEVYKCACKVGMTNPDMPYSPHLVSYRAQFICFLKCLSFYRDAMSSFLLHKHVITEVQKISFMLN